MFPLGISIAAAVRLGHAVGSQTYSALRRIALGAIMISVLMSVGFAVIYLTLGRQTALLFTNETEVVDLAARLMIIAGIFQIADGIQATSAGCLRGLADIRLRSGQAGACPNWQSPQDKSHGSAYVGAHAEASSLYFCCGCSLVPHNCAQSPESEICGREFYSFRQGS